MEGSGRARGASEQQKEDEEEDEELYEGLELEHLTDEELQAILDAEAESPMAVADKEEEAQPRRKFAKRDLSSENHPAQYHEISPISTRQSDYSPPTLDSCIAQVSKLLNGRTDWSQVLGREVGVSGVLGIKKGIVSVQEIGKIRWESSRRIERCMRD